MNYKINQLLSSKEAKSLLKVSDCHLAHIRGSGKIKFTKKGNAYLYSINDIIEYSRVLAKTKVKDKG